MRGVRLARVAASVLALLGACVCAGHAAASIDQVSILQDDPHLMGDPVTTVAKLRLLGVDEVRVLVRWQLVAPRADSHRRPAGFNAADPAAYPPRNWIPWDNIVKQAETAGIQVDFDVGGGAPLWATGHGSHSATDWEPNAGEYRQFVHALGVRYSGDYNPMNNEVAPGDPSDLPAVTTWSIWNEPDYGPTLAPQGLPGQLTIEHSPQMYRALVSAGWNALHATGHEHDTFMFGELAPRGESHWGVWSGMTPLVFLRALYCLDSHYRPLRGAAARLRGCPKTAAGSRSFRENNPGLFESAGFADHPYMRWYPPDREPNPDPVNHLKTDGYASLALIGQLIRGLDRVQGVYGAHPHMPIYDTEFGYLTTPPKHNNQIKSGSHRYSWASQVTAAYYLNWAEYISWRTPRLKSFAQYLLYDPLPATKATSWGGFASGLINHGRKQIPKPTFYAWRFPLYMPITTDRRGRRLELWGCLRPAHFAILDGDGPQTAEIQFAPGSSRKFSTIQSVTVTNPANCYFDVRLTFPGSGTVRLMWKYPVADPLLGAFDESRGVVYSRQVTIKLR
jgi:hypothetical protein